MRLFPESQTYALPGEVLLSTTTPPGLLRWSGSTLRSAISVKSRRPTSTSAIRSPAAPRVADSADATRSTTTSPAPPPPFASQGPQPTSAVDSTNGNEINLTGFIVVSSHLRAARRLRPSKHARTRQPVSPPAGSCDSAPDVRLCPL